MKSFALFTAVLALGFALTTGDAEAARRLGGGKSMGMQREAVSPQKSPAMAPTAPNQAAAPAASSPLAGAPAAQPKRSWMGPVMGLAAGLGLAALASHFGFGEEMASMLMMGLIAMVVVMVIGAVLRRRNAGQQGALQYAGAEAGLGSRQPDFTSLPGSSGSRPVSQTGNIPADFDAAGFLRTAKVNFLRLQVANDSGNLDDIREFTSPEMFAEIRLNLSERGPGTQESDVTTLEAELLDVAEEASRYVASVRFHGLIREERNGPAEPFDEIWHLAKPRDGGRGWVLAGIQQIQ